MSFVIGIDVGTTGTKSVLADENGVILSESYKGYELYSDKSGHAEQNAEDWWDAVVYTVKDCIKDVANIQDICAIALSTQGGSMVPVDELCNPLSNVISWMDTRGSKQNEELLKLHNQDFYYNKTGWKLSNQLSFIQIKWLYDNRPDLFNKAYKFVSTIDYINYKLTGQFAIDPSNAGMTQLINIKDKKWDSDLLEILKINADKLPSIIESGSIIGELHPSAAEALGLPQKVKVVSGGHDQYCAALGAGAINDGDMFLSTGTAWVVTGIFDKPVFDTFNYFAPGNHVVDGKWGLLSSLPTAGVSMEWFRNNLGLTEKADDNSITHESFAEIDRKSSEKGPGSEGVMFYPHFAGSSAPTWSSANKATILGLELHHDRYNIARAVMEGVVYDINWMLETFKEKAGDINCLIVLGGASKSRLWTQIIADVTGMPVYTSGSANTACIGASILAGIGAGIFTDAKEGYSRFVRKQTEVLSNTKNHLIYQDLYNLYKKRFELLKECY